MNQPDDPVFAVLNEIGICAQLSANAFERAMPEGMTLAQFVVLNHFVRLGGAKRPGDLARAFQVTKSTMASTLARLEAKGLVRRRADGADARAALIEITPAGAKMRGRCVAALGPQLDALRERLGSESFAELLPGLRRLRQDLDANR
ncbi:MAG: MarR family winged helix-turn-helix transcriptional regulator [Tagaea sp.]